MIAYCTIISFYDAAVNTLSAATYRPNLLGHDVFAQGRRKRDIGKEDLALSAPLSKNSNGLLLKIYVAQANSSKFAYATTTMCRMGSVTWPLKLEGN